MLWLRIRILVVLIGMRGRGLWMRRLPRGVVVAVHPGRKVRVWVWEYFLLIRFLGVRLVINRLEVLVGTFGLWDPLSRNARV